MRVINRYAIPAPENDWQGYCDQESGRLALWCMMRDSTRFWRGYSAPIALGSKHERLLWLKLHPDFPPQYLQPRW